MAIELKSGFASQHSATGLSRINPCACPTCRPTLLNCTMSILTCPAHLIQPSPSNREEAQSGTQSIQNNIPTTTNHWSISTGSHVSLNQILQCAPSMQAKLEILCMMCLLLTCTRATRCQYALAYVFGSAQYACLLDLLAFACCSPG